MAEPRPSDQPLETNGQPAAASKWTVLPVWWWVMAAVLVGGSFAVRNLDQAGGRIALVLAVLLSLLIAATRYLWRPHASFAVRLLPVGALVALIVSSFAAVRVDEMDGNLIPKRVSFRWQPAPDARLAKLEPSTPEKGIDLTTTTDEDFPCFLGPQRNGYLNRELDADWDAHPPEMVWKKEEFGAGHSGFAAVNGYAVTLEQRGEQEIVSCYEVTSGEVVWTHAEQTRHETVPGGVGPRSTPLIANGRVYTMGATGIFLCLEGANGEVLWRKDFLSEINTTAEEEFNKIQWGRAASPLLDGNRIIVPLGLKADPHDEESGATLIALDALTGEEIWRKGNYQISYASPVIATLDGTRQLVLVCESEACGFDAETGEELWSYPWPGNSAANASCSQAYVVDAEHLLLSKAYAHGAALLRVRQDHGDWQAEKVWYKRVMKTKFTNPVLFEDHFYGLDDGILGCIEQETGKRIWKRGRYGHGQVLLVGSKLLVQAESGDVALVEPTPEEFRELGRFSPIEGRTWNYPCLYGKYLLVRNSQQAACYRLP